MSKLIQALNKAIEKDPTIVVDRSEIDTTLGSDPRWLKELGLDKSDLIRLQRLGLAFPAHYETEGESKRRMVGQYMVTGPIRKRWVLIKPEV